MNHKIINNRTGLTLIERSYLFLIHDFGRLPMSWLHACIWFSHSRQCVKGGKTLPRINIIDVNLPLNYGADYSTSSYIVYFSTIMLFDVLYVLFWGI